VGKSVVYVIHCRDKDGREFTQHIEATDAEIVDGKLRLRHRGKWISYPPELWVEYAVDER
jgi:hypothetical protein